MFKNDIQKIKKLKVMLSKKLKDNSLFVNVKEMMNLSQMKNEKDIFLINSILIC